MARMFLLALRGGLSLGNIATGTAVGLVGVQRALMIDGLLAVFARLFVGHWWMWARSCGRIIEESESSQTCSAA
jgi:hypothetical protein